MHEFPVVIFDDGQGLLSPLTDLRAAFEVRTGALTTLERLRADATLRVVAWEAPETLHALVKERNDLTWMGDLRTAGPKLLINGRCPVLPREVRSLPLGHALVEAETGGVIAAVVDETGKAGGQISKVVRGDASGCTVHTHAARALLSRPWHVRTFRDACIAADLEILMRQARPPGGHAGVVVIGDKPLSVHPTARVYPTAVFDVEAGPVFVDEAAVVRPGAIVCGPAYIGPHTTVLDRTLIKSNTAIGPWCKVAGEVGGTIFQGYANKAHDGHLGDSWVGEWVNLGAGTTNSNLLNTYGEVIARAMPEESNERTGETFLGAIIGDHVKTAICTRIMTGAVVGMGTMWAAGSPLSGAVPAFSWVTDSGTKAYRFEKFLEVVKAAMGRRKTAPSGAYLGRLKSLIQP